MNFLGSRGEIAARYGGLTAFDATHRALPSALRVKDGRVLIAVNDRGARYPVTVDPLVQQGGKLVPNDVHPDKRQPIRRRRCYHARWQHRDHRGPDRPLQRRAPRGSSRARAARGPSSAQASPGNRGRFIDSAQRRSIGGRQHGADRRRVRQRPHRRRVGVHPLWHDLDPAGEAPRERRRWGSADPLRPQRRAVGQRQHGVVGGPDDKAQRRREPPGYSRALARPGGTGTKIAPTASIDNGRPERGPFRDGNIALIGAPQDGGNVGAAFDLHRVPDRLGPSKEDRYLDRWRHHRASGSAESAAQSLSRRTGPPP